MKHKVFRSIIAFMLVIGLVALQAPTPARAATLTVTNNNDSGPGSLRQAILDASSGDTIDFDADYTITLSSQLPIIDKELTINGNGAANTIIEASDCNYTTYCATASYRVLEVGATGDLTLDSVTIRHGQGGIYSAGAVTVMNSIVAYNYSYVNGGGIYSIDGTVSVVNSNFNENLTNTSGGGIYIYQGTLNVTESTFTANGAVDGGGIFNLFGTTSITDSTFSGNYAEDPFYETGRGGGIAIGHTLTVINSTFSNNYAYDGSGIYISASSTLEVMNTLFSDNVAHKEGGGIYKDGGTATIENSTFSGNTANNSGGPWWGGGGGIRNIGPMTVTDSTFSQNSSANYGGGILNSSLLVVTNSTFSSNNAVIAGGGVLNLGGPATITNSTFSNNSAQYGGGIHNDYFGTMTVENSTLSGNSSVSGGGGVQNFETLHLINTIIANSTSGADCYNELGDVIATNINNLIETNGPSGHMCGTPALSADPMLGPLADNGGSTQTMALLAGSPAIDAGDDATCEATDQRGIARPQGVACDIGAFELEVANPTIEVSIDIKTSSDTNPINLKSKGKIPVAILSTPEFDAHSMVDKTSLTFGKTGDEASLAFCNKGSDDVNEDGLFDLVCHFYADAAGFQIGDLEGILKGENVDDTPLEGRDVVTILD